MPPEDTTSERDLAIDERGREASEKRLDTLFGVTSEEDPPKKEEAVEEDEIDSEEAEEKEEEESKDDSKKETTEEDDSEVDWDAEDSKKEADEDADLKDESAARKQAKIRGREVKQLNARLTERELEIENLKKELSEVKTRAEEVEAVKIKPHEHPEYKELHDSVISDVRTASELLTVDDPSAVVRNFGPFMADYLRMDSLDGKDRQEAHAALKGSIADALKLGGDLPYAEMDVDEQRSHATTINEVMRIIQRNAGKTKDLQKLYDNLESRARTGQLAIGVREYTNRKKEFDTVLNSIGELPDEAVDADPFSMPTAVSKLVKGSPEAKNRLEKAKAEVLEALIGPRALTQDEIDRLEANGTDVREFQKNRVAAYTAKQQKLAAMFVQGLMLRPAFKDMAKRLAELEGEKEADESELDALRKTRKRTDKNAPVKKEEKVPAKDRPSAADKLFDTSDD